jgi:hypothetical protein
MTSMGQPLVRNEDPGTSFAAARRAARASSVAMELIAEIMADGVARMDEEIWEACRTAGLFRSLDVIRHARLALVRSGQLLRPGGTRQTKNGTSSRLWVKPCQNAGNERPT